MRFTPTALAVILTATASAGIARDLIEERVPAVEFICETTDSSPYLHNVEEMAGNLNAEDVGTRICLNHGAGSGECGPTQTGWSGNGGAAFQLCKFGDGQGFRVSLASGFVLLHLWHLFSDMNNTALERV